MQVEVSLILRTLPFTHHCLKSKKELKKELVPSEKQKLIAVCFEHMPLA